MGVILQSGQCMRWITGFTLDLGLHAFQRSAAETLAVGGVQNPL